MQKCVNFKTLRAERRTQPPLHAVARLLVKRGLWQKRLWRLAKTPLEYQALDAAQAAHSITDFQMLVARYVWQSLFEFLSMVCGNTGEDASGKGRYFFEKMIA